MTIDYYYMDGSPPCALVSLTLATLGVESEVNYNFLDFTKNEHKKPEFLKINPQHTAPTIVDDGFSLCESRSIARYLASKFGNTKLYPQELKARALIDQRLDFDLGTLFSRFTQYYYPLLFGGGVDEGKFPLLQDSLGVLNTFLDNSDYAAGSELTLADLSLGVTVSLIKTVGISIEKFPNIVRWLDLLTSEAPKFEAVVGKYMKHFKDFVDMHKKN